MTPTHMKLDQVHIVDIDKPGMVDFAAAYVDVYGVIQSNKFLNTDQKVYIVDCFLFVSPNI